MKVKRTIMLNEEIDKKLSDISRMSGVSKSSFIEKSVAYVIENNLETEVLFGFKGKRDKQQKIEKQHVEKSGNVNSDFILKL